MILNKKLYKSDYYFNKEYAQLYCGPNDSILNYHREFGQYHFSNISIISPLPKEASQSALDASTPYGYGGIATDIEDASLLKTAFLEYKSYLKEIKVIAEFYRFHPFTNVELLKEHLDYFEQEREVVFIDIQNGLENRWKGYSSTTRNIIRKSKRRLETSESNDLDEFINLYNKTMQKNKASNFYFFNRSYFENLMQIPNTKLLRISLGDVAVSMGIFFFKGDIAHYHLSANNYEYQKEQGNYLLLDYASDFAEKLECKYLMLGGGRTKDKNDTLFKFKSKFSPLKKNFYIGGVISDKAKYESATDLILKNRTDEQAPNYFLKYRL